MALDVDSLGLDRLSVDEKLELVDRLWDEIVSVVPPGGLLSDAQRAELRRRVTDAETHPEDSVAWDDALAATLRRLTPGWQARA